MVIYTPRLCNDVAFLPPKEVLPNDISCDEIVTGEQFAVLESEHAKNAGNELEDIAVLKSQLLNDAERELAEVISQGSSTEPTFIGGVEVGAQIAVGSEGRVIEKSVVVGGGKETYVDTIASSAGATMSEKELKKLNIANAQDIEKIKKNLQKIAGKKGWKLDVVDTPRGREFRGVIGTEDQEPKNQKRKGRGEELAGEAEEGTEETYKEDL
jgi:protein OS-9